MMRWFRPAWLLLSGAWFIWLHSFPLLQWASVPLYNPPRGLDLWMRALRDWRHSWLFLPIVGILVTGFALDLLRPKVAAYLNVGLYAFYVLWWIPGLMSAVRGKAEPEGVAYMIAFGGSAVVILVVNSLLYAAVWRRIQNK
jgi:hypothetical protein